MEEARALYEESVAAAPDIRQTLLGWARLEEADRNFDAAARAARPARRSCARTIPACVLSRAVLLGRMQRYDEALAVLDAHGTRQSQRRPGSAPNELLEKGRLLDQMGRYDEAFAAFDEGKRLAREVTGHVYLDAARAAD